MTKIYDTAQVNIGFDYVKGQGWEAFDEDENILIGGVIFPTLSEMMTAVTAYLDSKVTK